MIPSRSGAFAVGSPIPEARSWPSRRPPHAFTLVEVVIAFAILASVLAAFYLALNRGILLSETNKQVKVAFFDAQSIAEEIEGVPFDEIMDPDYPSPSAPNPRFRHLQYIDLSRIFGTNPLTGLPNEHMQNEKIRVWYGTQLDTADSNGNGDRTDALPLPIVTGSDALTNLAPSPGTPVEQNRPAPTQGTLFVTPDPLYITVEVTWTGPLRPMAQRITFVRSR